jgi:hypothetical protein
MNYDDLKFYFDLIRIYYCNEILSLTLFIGFLISIQNLFINFGNRSGTLPIGVIIWAVLAGICIILFMYFLLNSLSRFMDVYEPSIPVSIENKPLSAKIKSIIYISVVAFISTLSFFINRFTLDHRFFISVSLLLLLLELFLLLFLASELTELFARRSYALKIVAGSGMSTKRTMTASDTQAIINERIQAVKDFKLSDKKSVAFLTLINTILLLYILLLLL